MKTVRRMLYRDIVASVTFVALAFLALFYFIDLVDQLGDVGVRGSGALHAALGAAYELPGHAYELVPIALLIGTIYSLARLAQNSEFTILRTGGLGPGQALVMLAGLGLSFSLLTHVLGDYVAPWSERQAVLHRAQGAEGTGGLRIGGAGAWIKERRGTPQGERSYSINIAATGSGGSLLAVRIFEFDADGRLVSRTSARQGRVADDGRWLLSDAEVTEWPAARDEAMRPVRQRQEPALEWASTLTPDVVAAAVLPLRTMSTVELWRYSAHLSGQEQASQRYEIQFWKKALYPLACLVMVALALPFAYLHARGGGISLKVFGGIMIGIGFVLLNNLAGHVGLLRGWSPWVAASAPSGLFLLLSLAAFAWLVRFR